jgi:threonine/homoserine/homoserine lactone efflux protein
MLHWIGRAIMCLLGLKTMLVLPEGKNQTGNVLDMAHAYLSALFLTLINPGIYLFLIAVLAALDMDAFGMGLRSSGLLLAGVFTGSLSLGAPDCRQRDALPCEIFFEGREAYACGICGLIIAASPCC